MPKITKIKASDNGLIWRATLDIYYQDGDAVNVYWEQINEHMHKVTDMTEVFFKIYNTFWIPDEKKYWSPYYEPEPDIYAYTLTANILMEDNDLNLNCYVDGKQQIRVIVPEPDFKVVRDIYIPIFGMLLQKIEQKIK